MNDVLAFIERVASLGNVRDDIDIDAFGQPHVAVTWQHGTAIFDLCCDYSWVQNFDRSIVTSFGFSLDGYALAMS